MNQFNPVNQYEQVPKKTKGKQKRDIKYIANKGLRQDTFYKRKAGIMKKAHELAVLTGNEVLLLLTSETGNVFTYATTKFQPIFSPNNQSDVVKTCLESVGISASQVYENQSWSMPQARTQTATPKPEESAAVPAPKQKLKIDTSIVRPAPRASKIYTNQPGEGSSVKREVFYPSNPAMSPPDSTRSTPSPGQQMLSSMQMQRDFKEIMSGPLSAPISGISRPQSAPLASNYGPRSAYYDGQILLPSIPEFQFSNPNMMQQTFNDNVPYFNSNDLYYSPPSADLKEALETPFETSFGTFSHQL